MERKTGFEPATLAWKARMLAPTPHPHKVISFKPFSLPIGLNGKPTVIRRLTEPDSHLFVKRDCLYLQLTPYIKELDLFGGPGRTRTGTSLRTADFKSAASTYSATGPYNKAQISCQAPILCR